MRPRERRDSGQQDLLRAGLDQIVGEAGTQQRFLEQQFESSYADSPGRPPLPTRLMTGLAIASIIIGGWDCLYALIPFDSSVSRADVLVVMKDGTGLFSRRRCVCSVDILQ